MMSKKSLPILISLSKRQKFVITALLLAAGLFGVQITGFAWRYQAIGVLALLTYLLSAWSLSEGLSGVEWFTVLTLPVFFTIGVGLFYFLLPAHWLARLPVILAYGVGIYILLLTENIFSVAAFRTIQLLRSAHAVGLLLILTTTFFLYDSVLSFRFSYWLNFVLVYLLSVPLILSHLWTVNLEEKITSQLWLYALSLSLILAEAALVFSFWPVQIASGSLFLVTIMYIILGLSQYQLSGRLFKKTINEYVGVGIVLLVIMLLTTRWGG